MNQRFRDEKYDKKLTFYIAFYYNFFVRYFFCKKMEENLCLLQRFLISELFTKNVEIFCSLLQNIEASFDKSKYKKIQNNLQTSIVL